MFTCSYEPIAQDRSFSETVISLEIILTRLPINSVLGPSVKTWALNLTQPDAHNGFILVGHVLPSKLWPKVINNLNI